AFEALPAGGAETVDVPARSMKVSFRERLGTLASRYKLPVVFGLPKMAAAGCLASHGSSSREPCRLHRQDAERSVARRHAGPATNQIRAGGKPEGRAVH